MTDIETPWIISQAAKHIRPGDEELPPVPISASIEAFAIIDEILRPGSEVSKHGEIIISRWAAHRFALRLQAIAASGSFATQE